MASNIQGMDTDHARQVSGQMDSHASAVSGVCAKLLARVAATSWVGSDKDAVQDDIGTHFLPNANALCADVQQQAKYLREKADQQDSVSS